MTDNILGFILQVDKMADTKSTDEDRGGMFSNLFHEIVSSPLNLGLVCVIAFLVYKIFKNRPRPASFEYKPEKQLPKLKRDFTIEELRKYDGNGEDGRVLVAVNGKVFDATKGAKFYGPGEIS